MRLMVSLSLLGRRGLRKKEAVFGKPGVAKV
jgi:hypothetical protein